MFYFQVLSLADRISGKAEFPSFPSKRSVFDIAKVWDVVEDPRLIGMCGQELLNFVHVVGGRNDLSSENFNKIMNFFGVSIPLCEQQYDRVMEFACQKLSQGRANDKTFEKMVKTVIRRWQDRWLVIGYNNIFYYEKPEDPSNSVRDNVVFDSETVFKIIHVGRTHVQAQIELCRRILRISIDKTANGLICLDYIIKAFKRSHYTVPHRFTSFAPIRDGNNCVFYADGIGYYHDVFEAFESARTAIMITDWWFSPEICLKRPIVDDIDQEESRLDKTLQRAARRGVKIWILIYKEFKYGLNTDSEHAEKHMESLHHNIRVIRHPNVLVSLWSHHEKIIIVDKKKVFMGGLDLCFGRMDGNNHPLFNNPEGRAFPGADYYNPLKKDIVQGRNYKTAMIGSDYPRMPWHDIAISIVGPVVNDYVVHYTNYWNHARESSNKILNSEEQHEADNVTSGDQIRNREGNLNYLGGIGQVFGQAHPNEMSPDEKLMKAISMNSKLEVNTLLHQEYQKQKRQTDAFESTGGFLHYEYERVWGPSAPKFIADDPRKLNFNLLPERPIQNSPIIIPQQGPQRVLSLRGSQQSGHILHFGSPNILAPGTSAPPFGMSQNPAQQGNPLFEQLQQPSSGLSPEFQELFRKTDWSQMWLSGNNVDQHIPGNNVYGWGHSNSNNQNYYPGQVRPSNPSTLNRGLLMMNRLNVQMADFDSRRR